MHSGVFCVFTVHIHRGWDSNNPAPSPPFSLTACEVLMMGRQFHIRVYGPPRKNPDPALLAQVVILLGRYLHQQQQQRQQQQWGGSATGRTGSGEAAESPRHRDKPAQVESSGHDTQLRDSNGDETAGGGSS